MLILSSGRGGGLTRPPGPAIQNKDTWQSMGMIAWWPVGPTIRELSQPRVAERVGGHHAAYSGSLSIRGSQFGLGLEPDGAAATHLTFTTSARLSFPSSEGTMSYWTKLFAATPATDDLSGFGMYVMPANFISHYPLSTGLVYCGEMSTDRPINGVSPLADVTRTDWHLVTVVSRAGTNNYRFFQNGRLMAQGTRGGWPSILTSARLYGQLFAGSSFAMNGWGCDFRIWNRALTDGEVWELYQPSTRWDLYWRPARTYVRAAVTVAANPFPALTVAI